MSMASSPTTKTSQKYRSFVSLLVATIAFIFILAFVRFILLQPNPSRTISTKRSLPAVLSPRLPQDYEQRVTTILKEFSAASGGGGAAALGAARTAASALLQLTVPPQYKDLHLALVLAFATLQQGYSGDPAKLVDGQAKLQAAAAPYVWLKTYVP